VPACRAVLFDLTPRQLERIDGTRLTAAYRRRLRRFRYGPGAFKIDYALSEPMPWRAADCRRAATVHLGGPYEEVARSEHDATHGRVPDRPFVLVAQQSVFDTSRAPAGKHTGWAYCHVPHGCDIDVTERIEAQIERFAPGFRDTVLHRHVMPPAALEAHNPNLVGGDIAGGANTLGQFLLRPFPRADPYATSDPRLYMCSSSTPPGGGVHGMCGYWAARSALRRTFRIDVPAALAL
jgi:phytoene dehydrogenase-like protein